MTTFLSLERMAYTLYDTLGRYSDKEVPTVLRVWSPQGDLTTKTIRIYMITVLGLYVRLHLLGPRGFAELREDQGG